MRRYFPSRGCRPASRLTLRKAMNCRRKRYPPALGLVKAIAVASNPDANREEFEIALRAVRLPENTKIYEEADQAYAKRLKDLEDAWRNPSLPLDTVWDEWEVKREAKKLDADVKAVKSYIAVLVHKAMMRFHMTGDPMPLITALAALQAPEALACVNRDSIDRLVDLLNARSKRLEAGRPRGHINRWRSARQVAAFIVKRIKMQWRWDHKTDEVPADVVENFVRDVIQFMKTWDATKRRKWLRHKPLTVTSVLALLNEEKSRRL
jgi:hypothetical protein